MIRFIVERISDGEFLDLELPISVSSAGSALNGPGTFRGSMEPDVGGLRTADGALIVDPYSTFIHEEVDGEIRGTWLVTRSELDGESWTVEGQGFSAYFAGRPFEGEYKGAQVDPLDAARHVVAHAQSFAGADIGVTVVGSSSVRVGTDSDQKADAAKSLMDARKAAWDAKAKPRKALQEHIKRLSAPFDKTIKALDKQRKALTDTYEAKVKAKAPAGEIAAAKSAVTAKSNQLAAAREDKRDTLQPHKDELESLREAEAPLKAAYDQAKDAYAAAKEQAQKDGGAWKILWWDTPDCLDAIREAVEAARYEWVEWSGWNADRSRVLKEIRCVPRVGRKQDSLVFVEGDNVIETVVLEVDSSEYANTVLAIGAGEGRDALRVTVSAADSRRRKVHVLDAKQVTKRDSLVSRAKAELRRRMVRVRVAGVRVIDHPNAEFGVFGVGDTILLDCEAGWLGRQRLWRRIESVERDGDSVADLMLGDPK